MVGEVSTREVPLCRSTGLRPQPTPISPKKIHPSFQIDAQVSPFSLVVYLYPLPLTLEMLGATGPLLRGPQRPRPLSDPLRRKFAAFGCPFPHSPARQFCSGRSRGERGALAALVAAPPPSGRLDRPHPGPRARPSWQPPSGLRFWLASPRSRATHPFPYSLARPLPPLRAARTPLAAPLGACTPLAAVTATRIRELYNRRDSEWSADT